MADEPNEDTQKTQPRPRKKGKKMPKPIDIPIPTESQIARDFTKIATAKQDDDEEDN